MAERERHRVREREHASGPWSGPRSAVLSCRGSSAPPSRMSRKAATSGSWSAMPASGKSAMLGVAREAWEESGYRVRGVALSGIAAENLESGSGIASRTIASLEHQWAQGRELLDDQDVLVIDEAGMIGSRQMERVLSEAERRGAKVVLVGDPEQLQAIEAGAAFRSLAERHPMSRSRKSAASARAGSRKPRAQLATGRTGEALDAYREHGMVHAAQTRERCPRESDRRLGSGPQPQRPAKPASF